MLFGNIRYTWINCNVRLCGRGVVKLIVETIDGVKYKNVSKILLSGDILVLALEKDQRTGLYKTALIKWFELYGIRES